MYLKSRIQSINVFTSAALVLVASQVSGPSHAHAADKQNVRIDGSSTVSPITMATAELFRSKNREIRVSVGVSGTGGGFKKFLSSEASLRTDITGASRPIKESELERAEQYGVEFIELPVALDGIAVVVHPTNSFVSSLSIDELHRIWEPGSEITNWSQVRSGFPNLPLKLYGPGPDSGTFDYFTEVVMGKTQASREDYTASENDNVLVQGVAGDRGGMGYFGFSYYQANKDRIKLIPISHNGGEPVLPNVDTIGSGEYAPLARPLFFYVNRAAADRPEVQAFVQFFFDNHQRIVEHPRVGYVSLPEDVYSLAKRRFEERITGTAFETETKQSLAQRYAIP